MRRVCILILMGVITFAAAATAAAHCQIPCGIYDDELRVEMIEEDIATIEKSMQQISALSGGERNATGDNQLVRWVMNKEDHAQKIQDVVTSYFMAQRVKPAPPSDTAGHAAYVTRLTLLHQLQVEAMKAKQTVDPVHVEAMRQLVGAFRKAYFGEEGSHSH